MKQRTKKILAGVVAGLLLVVGGGYALVEYNFGAQSTDKLVSIANQFQPDESWELVSENLQPPRRACLGGSCNSLTRRWKVDGLATKEQLQAAINNSGWSMTIEGDCNIASAAAGSGSSVCNSRTDIDGHEVSVGISGASDNLSESYVGLSVRGY